MGQIVWLASYPKSGNTWVRAFLHNYITDAQAPHGINKLHEFSASECNAAFFRAHDPRPAPLYTEAEVQRMRPAVHTDLTRLHDDLVFVKTHNAALAVHGVPLCTPAVTAGAIYIVRDPRDVAVSYARYTKRDLDEIIGFMGNAGAANRSTDAQVFELLSSWSRHAESWAAVKRRLLVRYEDLLAAPEKGFGRIVRFLGGEVDTARLARAIRHCDFVELAAQEAAHGYEARGPNEAAAFFHTGQAAQWKGVLTAAQVKRIEADHASVMRGFGYLG
jgi:hypothetical protein